MISLTDPRHAAAAIAHMRRLARHTRRDVAAASDMGEQQYGAYELDLALIPREAA